MYIYYVQSCEVHNYVVQSKRIVEYCTNHMRHIISLIYLIKILWQFKIRDSQNIEIY